MVPLYEGKSKISTESFFGGVHPKINDKIKTK